MIVLCMEEWTNVFNILLFKMNFMLNQVCVSCGMCVGTNEASQETNEENTDIKTAGSQQTTSAS